MRPQTSAVGGSGQQINQGRPLEGPPSKHCADVPVEQQATLPAPCKGRGLDRLIPDGKKE
jgi:hypothetical protein